MIRARKSSVPVALHAEGCGAAGGTECSAFSSCAALSVQKVLAYRSGDVGL